MDENFSNQLLPPYCHLIECLIIVFDVIYKDLLNSRCHSTIDSVCCVRSDEVVICLIMEKAPDITFIFIYLIIVAIFSEGKGDFE